MPHLPIATLSVFRVQTPPHIYRESAKSEDLLLDEPPYTPPSQYSYENLTDFGQYTEIKSFLSSRLGLV